MNPPSFIDRRRVRYHEADMQGIVFNARYLEYIDVAMTEWFRWIGWDYRNLIAAGCDPSLVSLSVEWSCSTSFDEELEIAVNLIALGSSSFTLNFGINSASDGRAVAAATVVYVNLDPARGKSRPLPPTVRADMAVQLVKEIAADGKS